MLQFFHVFHFFIIDPIVCGVCRTSNRLEDGFLKNFKTFKNYILMNLGCPIQLLKIEKNC